MLRTSLSILLSLFATNLLLAQQGIDLQAAATQLEQSLVAVPIDVASISDDATRFPAPRLAPSGALNGMRIPFAVAAMGGDSKRGGFAVAADLVIVHALPSDETTLLAADGREISATVVVRDHVTGLAAVRLDGGSLNALEISTEATIWTTLVQLGLDDFDPRTMASNPYAL